MTYGYHLRYHVLTFGYILWVANSSGEAAYRISNLVPVIRK